MKIFSAFSFEKFENILTVWNFDGFMSFWQNSPWGTLQVANGSEGQIIDRTRLKSFLGEDVAESRVFGKMHRQESSLTFRRLGGNCKTWKTISTSSVCLWRYLPSKAKANVWGQNLNCCDLLVSANFTWLCIVRHAKKKKVLFCHTTGRFSHIFLLDRWRLLLFCQNVSKAKRNIQDEWWWCFLCCKLDMYKDFVHTTVLRSSSQQADISCCTTSEWSKVDPDSKLHTCTVAHVVFQIWWM